MAPAAARLAALAALVSSASASPCYGRFNHTYQLETPCYSTIAQDGNLTIRSYAESADVTLVQYPVSGEVTIFQEAEELGVFYVIEYFIGSCNKKNESLLSSRTVPLVVRPPTPAHDEWLIHMALAPSKWPASRPRVPPTYNVSLVPIGDVVIAAQYALFELSPQPSDLAALCKTLEANLKKFGGWEVDAASPYTYSYAGFNGELFYGPWDVECWAGVRPTQK